MLFYERMKDGESSREALAEVSPSETADAAGSSICRLDFDDDEDDRHKMKIELSPELAEVRYMSSANHIASPTRHAWWQLTILDRNGLFYTAATGWISIETIHNIKLCDKNVSLSLQSQTK